MKIGEVLRIKGHDVVTITETQTVLEAVRLLVARNIGGLVVTDGDRPTGILTERDVLRLSARGPGDLGSVAIASVMTRDVITASPGDDLIAIMGVMTDKKVRHLPVMDGDELVGIVSIGDLVNQCRLESEKENSQLRQYIQGAG